ncbi:MAG: hypothetical protein J6X62_02070 [Bacteroidales bacterium]|nr:hypothetical protein [Bacteroidales bacterium]
MNNTSRTLLTIAAIMLATGMTAACKRDYEEFYFAGRVIGAELCSSTTMGYMIQVDRPSNIGDTITLGEAVQENAVMAYRSPRKLVKDERVYGVAYLTKDFAALNCIGIYNYKLPEMVLLSVDEDSATVFSKTCRRL